MRWFLVIAVVAACGKSKATCESETADLMTLFRTMDHTPSLVLIPDDVHLVERPELPAPDFAQAPVVIARPSGLEFRNERLDELGLTARLADVWNKTRDEVEAGKERRGYVWDHRIYIVIDRDTPWSTVAATARAASLGGYTKWIAVFSKPPQVATPPRSAVSDQLDALVKGDDANKAATVAKLMSDIVKSCAPMRKAFGRVSPVENEDKAAVLIDAIGPALLECNCDVDIPSFRSVFFAAAANMHPLTVLVLQLDEKAKPLALPAITPWHDAVKQLTTATAWITTRVP